MRSASNPYEENPHMAGEDSETSALRRQWFAKRGRDACGNRIPKVTPSTNRPINEPIPEVPALH